MCSYSIYLCRTIPRPELHYFVEMNFETLKDKGTYSPLSNEPVFDLLTNKVFKNEFKMVEIFRDILTNPKSDEADRKFAENIVEMVQSVLADLKEKLSKKEKRKSIHDLPPSSIERREKPDEKQTGKIWVK